MLADIRFYSKDLAAEGTPVQALPEASMALLERFVRGEIVPEQELRPVLKAAEKLEGISVGNGSRSPMIEAFAARPRTAAELGHRSIGRVRAI